MEKVDKLNIIRIDNGICFKCGGVFEVKGLKIRTDHHCIPQVLKPVFNIIVPLHKCCHDELNALYASSQPEAKIVGMTILKRALNDVQGLKGHHSAGFVKLEKVEAKLQKAVDEIEQEKDGK